MAVIGYSRVSTHEQSTNLQDDALEAAGCERIFKDQMSGASTTRPGLTEAMSFLRPGDQLVVWRLDRLGRNLRHLIEVVNDLSERESGFRSITESVDTNSSGGKLIFHIFGALAEFERALIRERVKAGLEASRVRGVKGGRPKAIDASKARAIVAMRSQGLAPKEICQSVGISRATYFRHVSNAKPGSA